MKRIELPEKLNSNKLRLLEKREKYLQQQCKHRKCTLPFKTRRRQPLDQPCISCQSRALSPEASIINSRLHTLRPRDKVNHVDNSLLCTSDYSSGSSLSSLDSLVYQHYNIHKNQQNDDSYSEASSQLCSEISDSDYDSDRISEEFYRDTRNARMLKNQNVTVIIPDHNICKYNRDEFRLEIIQDVSCIPIFNDFTIQASKVVSVEPHGAEFYSNQPALIYLPVTEKIRHNDRLICLCSNTPEGKSPCWEEMHRSSYTFRGGRIVIKALHFSLFAVVVERPYPEVHRIINHHGGTLRMACVPGLAINFSADSVEGEVDAFMRVCFETETANYNEKALASPIIMVGPHSYQFHSDSDPVTVSLPIPDYTKIKNMFAPLAKLSIWQSPTKEEEPFLWEQINVDFEIVSDENANVSVRFQVKHFSFFKALWDVLSGSLYEVKVGAAYFYSYISFSMMCQAFMEENENTHCFGLEVLCFRSDNKYPEVTNYKYRVGSSLKPKLVRPGVIVVRLKSELFEADVGAGEDPLLIKEELDFRGREFEKQFACRFKQGPISKGAFGKVIVERKVSTGQREPLFEFNLNKTGRETETTLENSERWSAVAIKNLADTLRITEDKNWMTFAQHIGFTKKEIRTKLKYSENPFYAMVNIYHERGGTPEEFVEALHTVSSNIRSRTSSPTESTSSGGSNKRAWLMQQQLFNLSLNQKAYEGDESDTTASDHTHSSSLQSRKRSSQSSGSQASANKRRRRLSDGISETMSSSEESVTDDFLHKKDARKLSCTDMWKISELMNTTNWRALGRTLGLEESILLNIEHAYKSTGFRECSYQMLLEWKERKPSKCTFGSLYTALVQENMNSVAKGMFSKLEEIP